MPRTVTAYPLSRGVRPEGLERRLADDPLRAIDEITRAHHLLAFAGEWGKHPLRYALHGLAEKLIGRRQFKLLIRVAGATGFAAFVTDWEYGLDHFLARAGAYCLLPDTFHTDAAVLRSWKHDNLPIGAAVLPTTADSPLGESAKQRRPFWGIPPHLLTLDNLRFIPRYAPCSALHEALSRPHSLADLRHLDLSGVLTPATLLARDRLGRTLFHDLHSRSVMALVPDSSLTPEVLLAPIGEPDDYKIQDSRLRPAFDFLRSQSEHIARSLGPNRAQRARIANLTLRISRIS